MLDAKSSDSVKNLMIIENIILLEFHQIKCVKLYEQYMCILLPIFASRKIKIKNIC